MERRSRSSSLLHIGIWTATLLLSTPAHAHPADTIRMQNLPDIVVTERHQTRPIRSATPLQELDSARLSSLNALQLSDAVKHFAGVTVKDYGGIGGLKTVSLRGLGAEHTTVSYDGIAIGNAQTGQVDIGRYSLENVDRLSLSTGQSDDTFQPARLFASAGVLNIQTLAPRFDGSKTTNLKASLKAGSWGLINPALLLEQKIGKRWALLANTEWMSADGRYPYTMHYGGANDSTSREKRKNTQVRTLRAEAGLFGTLSDTEQWRLKAYYYQASRGLPGATTLYYDYAAQHLWDRNVFLQSQYAKEFSPKLTFKASAKWAHDYQRYHDPDYKGSTGETDMKYTQQEYYLSAALRYRIIENLSLSASTDGSVQTLDINQSNYTGSRRYSWLTALAAKYVDERITATASVLGTVVNEHTAYVAPADGHRRLSPFVSVAFKPFASEELRLRAFWKEISRLPTFNDIRYTDANSPGLKPENTSQLNVGVTYTKAINRLLPYLSLTIDAYYNKVDDKIIALPTKNIFVWSMVNLGKVDIKGMDAAAELTLEPLEGIRLNLSGNYTYQRALDVTDPGGKTYNQQIAYTPRVSASGQARLETPWINLSYAFIHSGKRYVLGQNLPENRLSGYTDHSIAASRNFLIGGCRTSLKLEILNLLNRNYEVVRNFPMPGRSVRATVSVAL